MKKKMFYGFTLFVFLFMLVAWQIAAAELAELQAQPSSSVEESESELAML